MARHYIGAVLTLKDNMSATLKGIRREQAQFRKDIENTRKSLERVYKQKYSLRLEQTAAMKKIKEVRQALEPLRKRVIVALAHKDMVSRQIRRIRNQLAAFGRMVFAPVITLKDKTGAVLNKVKNAIFNVKTLIAGAVTSVGIGKMLGAGAQLEQQMISMEHFIGIQNKGMSAAEIKKLRDEYIKQLRENANLTPFSTQEVLAAGARAINIAGGNITQAMELVKLAENMAALNPGKTLSDAIEALADLRMGETERMKEFGFKISQEDIEAAGGVQNIIEKQIKPFFAGGAEKLSQSGIGLWSTIVGKIGTKIQDFGFNILEKLKPQMESLIELIDRFSPTMDRWSEKIASGIDWALNKFGEFTGFIGRNMPAATQIIGMISDWITQKFGWVGEIVSNLHPQFSTTWGGIKQVMQTSWKVIGPILNLVANAAHIVADVFQLAWPTIKSVVLSVWKIVAPILEKLGDALGWVADKASRIAEWLDRKLEARNKPQATGIDAAKVDGSHALGLKRVPYDGYIAKLHKDEAVIPAHQNPFIHPQTAPRTIIIQKIADRIDASNPVDVNLLLDKLEERLLEVAANMGTV